MLFLSPAHACRVVSVYILSTNSVNLSSRSTDDNSEICQIMFQKCYDVSTFEETVRKCFVFDYNNV